MRLARCAFVGLLVAPALASAAVTFPADSAYVPLRCGGAVMTDPLADVPAYPVDLDIVGDPAAPAGLRAADAQYLYIRLRFDGDPAPGGALRPDAYGIELDLDGDLTTYELLILVDGIGGANAVQLFTNHTVQLPNDPADGADLPAVKTYPFAMNARTTQVTSSNSTPDFLLDFAVPWADLKPLGLDHATPTRVWAGSSAMADRLDGDIACHDGASGPAALDATTSDPTTGDPNGGGSGAGMGRLEGGGGCSTGGGGSPIVALLIALTARMQRRSRRRRCD